MLNHTSSIQLIRKDNQICGVENSVYPDNVPFVKMIGGQHFEDMVGMIVRPLTFTDFAAAMFLADAFRWRGHKLKKLIIPFIPGSRQDRMNPVGDFLFTAKSVANMINEREFEVVYTLDPHSDVSSGLINNCVVRSAAFVVNQIRFSMHHKYDVVVAPDAGAEKRAANVARCLNLPLCRAWKNRDLQTGNITGFGFGELPNKEKIRALIVDDICDGGGTFVGLAQILKEKVSSLDLFVTHGIFSKGTKELKKYFNKIYTTDSVPRLQPNGVTILDILQEMVQF